MARYRPETWQNVPIPNFGSTLDASRRAGDALGDAVAGLGTAVTDTVDDISKRDTDAFIAELNAAPDDATRNAMLAEAQQGFNWLQLDRTNKAIRDAELHDFARGAEKRAVDTAKLARDRFGLEQDRVGFEKARLDIDKAKEADENLLRDTLRPDKIKTSRLSLAEAQRTDVAAKKELAFESQAQRELNAIDLDFQNLPADQALSNFGNYIQQAKNDLMPEKYIKPYLDRYNKHLYEGVALEVTDADLKAAKMYKEDGSIIYSKAANRRLERVIANRVGTTWKHSTKENNEAMAKKAIAASEHTIPFAQRAELEGMNLKQRREYENDNRVSQFIGDMRTYENDPKKYAENYTKKRATLVQKRATAAQLKMFDDETRPLATSELIVPISTTKEVIEIGKGGKLETTTKILPLKGADSLAIIRKASKDITREDLARANTYIKKKAAKKFGGKITDAEALEILDRSLSEVPQLKERIRQARLRLDSEEKGALRASATKMDRLLATEEEKEKAYRAEQAFRGEISEQGRKGFIKTMNPIITDYYKNVQGSGILWADGEVENDTLNRRINRVMNVIQRFGGDKLEYANAAVATRDFLLSGEVEEEFIGENLINIRMPDGSKKTINQMTDEEIYSRAMSIAGESEVADPHTAEIFSSATEKFQTDQLRKERKEIISELKYKQKKLGISKEKFESLSVAKDDLKRLDEIAIALGEEKAKKGGPTKEELITTFKKDVGEPKGFNWADLYNPGNIFTYDPEHRSSFTWGGR